VTWKKVVEMESGENATDCGHEVVTVLSRVRGEERRGEERKGEERRGRERRGEGEAFVTLRFNKPFSYKRFSFNYC
jgi:hypothetical protein